MNLNTDLNTVIEEFDLHLETVTRDGFSGYHVLSSLVMSDVYGCSARRSVLCLYFLSRFGEICILLDGPLFQVRGIGWHWFFMKTVLSAVISVMKI